MAFSDYLCRSMETLFPLTGDFPISTQWATQFFSVRKYRMLSTKFRPIQRTGLPLKTCKASPARNQLSHRALLNERENCIEMLKQFGAARERSVFFDKAMILLTRHWAGTSWAHRASLLRSADWLIRMGSRGFPSKNKMPHKERN